MSIVQIQPSSQSIRDFMARHKEWCEAQLGVPFDQMFQLQLDNSIAAIAASTVVSGAEPDRLGKTWRDYFLTRLEVIHFGPGLPPAIGLRMTSRGEGPGWTAKWLDTPVFMKFRGLEHGIVVMNVPYVESLQGPQRWREVILVRRDAVEAFLAFYRQAEQDTWQPSIRDQNGDVSLVRPCRWDDLVLDPLVVHLLRDDYESFFSRQEWFAQKNLPFRRGYLLYGPPGNGKTSAIRAMLSRPGVVGHTANLFAEYIGDDDVEKLLREASEAAPSVVLLEDIDRVFDGSQTDGPNTRVSMTKLLNCLDGATTRDGVIVVATANNPTTLDAAILRRPGRFDRVVAFKNPTKELCTRYFQKLSPELTEEELAPCAEACEGFSFAQLQETYVLAGQFAFEESGEITVRHLTEAANELRRALYSADWKNLQQGGFKPQRLKL